MDNTIEPSDLPNWIGKTLPPTRSVILDQKRINRFADITEDHNFIHVDVEAAQKTPMGGTIAHGFLVLSMLGGLGPEFYLKVKGTVWGFNYGFNKIRFIAPVLAGDKIRALPTVKDIVFKDDKNVLITYEVCVETGSGQTAVVCEWLCQHVLGDPVRKQMFD